MKKQNWLSWREALDASAPRPLGRARWLGGVAAASRDVGRGDAPPRISAPEIGRAHV